MSIQSHYPSYNVMEQKDHWDHHTQEIVTDRLVQKQQYQLLTDVEVEIIRSLCTHLIHDQRADIIQYVIRHIDQFISSNVGESQRKPGIPPAPQLIRDGIQAIDQLSMQRHMDHYFHLSIADQTAILSEISQAKNHNPVDVWGIIPPKELFNMLLKLTTEAYYSHPVIWSEIGYAGPAYPRGYVRTQGGHLDPWEAKRES